MTPGVWDGEQRRRRRRISRHVERKKSRGREWPTPYPGKGNILGSDVSTLVLFLGQRHTRNAIWAFLSTKIPNGTDTKCVSIIWLRHSLSRRKKKSLWHFQQLHFFQNIPQADSDRGVTRRSDPQQGYTSTHRQSTSNYTYIKAALRGLATHWWPKTLRQTHTSQPHSQPQGSHTLQHVQNVHTACQPHTWF